MDGIRVAVLDDHRLVAEGITALLARHGADVVLTASSWDAFIASDELPVDVAVLDLHLGDGILIAHKVKAMITMGIAVVVVSRHADSRSVSSALHAGASAFVAKADEPGELLAAIRQAAGRATAPAGRVVKREPAVDVGLGKREERALVLYASGRTIREVAAEMTTTEETVKSYVKRGRRKFRAAGIDIGSRSLLRRHALREGWLNDLD